MYGLVNRAIQDLVLKHYDSETWETITQKAGVGAITFQAMEQYSDEVTYDLVHATSQLVGEPVSDLLEAFGRHWVMYTAHEGYGEILAMGGHTLIDFLRNLDNLHASVGISFPNLTPPSFWCSDETDSSMRLHYQSQRQGLAPMVVGLLQGLGEMFRTPVRVTHDRSRDDGAEHDEFLVEFATGA